MQYYLDMQVTFSKIFGIQFLMTASVYVFIFIAIILLEMLWYFRQSGNVPGNTLYYRVGIVHFSNKINGTA